MEGILRCMYSKELENLKLDLERERRTCDIMMEGVESFLDNPTRGEKAKLKFMWELYSDRYNKLTKWITIIREMLYENGQH